jgi:hypothetical protein
MRLLTKGIDRLTSPLLFETLHFLQPSLLPPPTFTRYQSREGASLQSLYEDNDYISLCWLSSFRHATPLAPATESFDHNFNKIAVSEVSDIQAFL